MMLSAGCAGSKSGARASGGSIDRRAVVRRHNPRVRSIDPFAALSVGNGEFAFTADVTGLQTFPQPYDEPFPLCTTAHWAWHTTPPPPGLDPGSLKPQMWETYGRDVPYATSAKGQEPVFHYLRENPHRMHLGRIGLELRAGDGMVAQAEDVKNIDQTLDLWAGLLTSRFEVFGQPVEVQTCCHPDLDMLAVRVRSPMMSKGMLRVLTRFPYPSQNRQMANWDAELNHRTRILDRRKTREGVRADVVRTIDGEDAYHIAVGMPAETRFESEGMNGLSINPPGEMLEFRCHFSTARFKGDLPTFDQTRDAAAKHWAGFWTTGGAIDLDGSTHTHAPELERRIVLSQYNTALHCAGSLPSAETGLLCNSWYGKFHLEMHWWHSVHFAAWDRFGQFERSLGYYETILPQAREIARSQGFAGARWPKMVGPDGRDSPSPVGPLLIWQQPHPIYYAELCYRRKPDRATLQRWQQIVSETAEFMASYAHLVGDCYVLGPPMKTVSENADTKTTTNPTFELAYWRWGLGIAQSWRERLGQPRQAKWDEVMHKLSPLPVQDGLYLMQEGMSDTYTKWNWEHPALLMPAALLPAESYDRQTMARTMRKVMDVWQWPRTWGWDYGVAAAVAANVGEPQLAVAALMIDSPKNRYHPNGHNYQRENLTSYLPGNGSLLYAVATMAAKRGFPDDGKWSVRSEKLSALV